jgi:hypothetical protein
MLHVRPKSMFSREWDVRDADGALVASLQTALLREGATVQVDGKALRIAREGMMTGAWQLLDGDEMLFEATKPSAFKSRFEVNVRGAWLDFSPVNWLMRGFTLVGPDWAQLGGIRKPSFWSRRIEIELDDRVPLEAKLLLLYCALLAWARQNRHSS